MKSRENEATGVGPTSIVVGDWRLDMAQRVLRRADGTPVPLTPRLFDALIYFVEHPGVLLDKDTLMAALWPGQVVEENNLNQTVAALRRALGDDASTPRYILTVPRRGFRWLAEARPADAVAAEPPAAAAGAVTTAAAPAAPARPASAASAGRRVALIAGAAALGFGAIGAGWWQGRQRGATELPAAPVALAVLPFTPLTASARDEVLELGMADSLITRLSTVPGVIVRSIGSIRRYAGPDGDPLRAARELDVVWVLAGTIQRSDEQVRVSARLLDATRAGSAVWSDQFDAPFVGVLEVQDTIARRVAERLAPTLSAHAVDRLAPAGTSDLAAYQLYLEGRYQAALFTREGLTRAIVLFERAIAADPDYVYAYVGLADAHRRTLFTANAAPLATFAAIRTAARRALEIAPTNGEAQAMVAWVSYLHDWDWRDAEQGFRRAGASNPSSVDAHNGLAHVLLTTGRGDEALGWFARARSVDPMSLLAHALEGAALAARGRADEGMTRIEHALAINPHFWIAHAFLGSLLCARGATERGLASLRQAQALSRGSAWAMGPLGHALATAGREAEARGVLAEMQARRTLQYISPSMIAMVQAGLGEIPAALDELERAHDERDLRLAYLQVEHRWAPLRDQPRFHALAQRLALDPSPPPHPLAL